MRPKSFGFVGTGAITQAMVRGLLADPAYVSAIHVSPRSADVAAQLAAEFKAVTIASSNQDVVDKADVVFLAIRPQIAEDVIRALTFRQEQVVVSVVAATERAQLEEWIGVDERLIQVIPLPFVAARKGVTALYPPDEQVRDIFDTLGTAVECGSKKEYDLIGAASAIMATYFGIMQFTVDWLAGAGLDKAKADAYIAPLFLSLAQAANEPGLVSFSSLSKEFATKGGLNEQVFAHFEANGGKDALTGALNSVLARIEGNPGSQV